MERIVGSSRLIVGLGVIASLVLFWSFIVLALLPSRIARIKACNLFGKVAGRSMLWLSGCPLEVEGREELDPRRPAIYVSNHTSIMDIFLGIWLAPVGTVGVAKKEVVFYPFLGQLYLLSGHLRIDRSRSDKAIRSLERLVDVVRKNRLSIWMWPEGTRSRDGRLLPFKKGIVHLATQTGLPVVPVVVDGAHEAWRKGSLAVRRVPLRIKVLPAVDTSGWATDTVEEHLEELHALFARALPPAQQPLALTGPTA